MKAITLKPGVTTTTNGIATWTTRSKDIWEQVAPMDSYTKATWDRKKVGTYEVLVITTCDGKVHELDEAHSKAAKEILNGIK